MMEIDIALSEQSRKLKRVWESAGDTRRPSDHRRGDGPDSGDEALEDIKAVGTASRGFRCDGVRSGVGQHFLSAAANKLRSRIHQQAC